MSRFSEDGRRNHLISCRDPGRGGSASARRGRCGTSSKVRARPRETRPDRPAGRLARAIVTWGRNGWASSSPRAARRSRARRRRFPSPSTMPYQATLARPADGNAPSPPPVGVIGPDRAATSDMAPAIPGTALASIDPRKASVRCQPSGSVQRRPPRSGRSRQAATFAASTARSSSPIGAATKHRQRSLIGRPDGRRRSAGARRATRSAARPRARTPGRGGRLGRSARRRARRRARPRCRRRGGRRRG